MERKNLKVFTKISFFTALATIIIMPLSIYTLSRTSYEGVEPLLGSFVLLAFIVSLFGLPLSVVSMFSKENLAKRIFALIINSLPVIVVIYGLTIEFIDEFFQVAP
ncbi:2-acyl-glycerophospho-ethanolamine acyltransferase [Priestia sp. FSL R5-0680]|uniref:2-acyl-glycerophospho-ethanolamine acyltransferase n=1 Tax=Priestia sp. FSL R5-0680 TaxID=2921582 RepID=UPI0030FC11FC